MKAEEYVTIAEKLEMLTENLVASGYTEQMAQQIVENMFGDYTEEGENENSN